MYNKICEIYNSATYNFLFKIYMFISVTYNTFRKLYMSNMYKKNIQLRGPILGLIAQYIPLLTIFVNI